MYHGATIGVVVPCHNEQLLIAQVLSTMPDFVDNIYVVDDMSTDKTVDVVSEYVQNKGIKNIYLIQHKTNQGIGGAIISGYKQAWKDNIDVIAVMAGNAQMDPDDLHLLLDPVAEGKTDYTKGNRLASGEAWHQIPHLGYISDVFLSFMTKVASGYWHIFDSQTEYTAISHQALGRIKLDHLWKRYGYLNYLLIMLNISDCSVADIPINPIYNIDKRKGSQRWQVIPAMSLVLIHGFVYRLFNKFIIRDAHPLVLFYFIGLITFLPGVIFGFHLLIYRLFIGNVVATSALLPMFLILFGINFLVFGLWFDMNANQHLKR